TMASWTEKNRNELEQAGVTVTRSDPTSWVKPSQGVTLSTSDRGGEVWVWASGECEVIVGDVDRGAPEQSHHDVTSEQELLGLLESFRVRFIAHNACAHGVHCRVLAEQVFLTE